jgi:catechol 2,3-dioxygenase-like lactoylglutathione lyase family enzyme
MMFKTTKIGHMGFWTRDLDRMQDFYTSVMGFRVTSRSGPDAPVPGGAAVFMRCDRAHHEIVFFQAPQEAPSLYPDTENSMEEGKAGFQHMVFEVPNRTEWLKALKHIKSCGVEIKYGPVVHGPEGDGFEAGSGNRAFYFTDPDGNYIEVYCDITVFEDEEAGWGDVLQ